MSITTLESDFPKICAASFNPLFDQHGRLSHLAKALARLKAKVPQDFIGGWSIKGKEIDTQYWRGSQTYTLSEAALLSVGLDPRKVNYDALFTTYGRYIEADEALYFLEDQYELIAKGMDANPQNQADTIDADRFFNWVKAYNVRIDERFRRLLNDRLKSRTSLRVTADPQTPTVGDKPLHRSSWDLHARIITAMAVTKYGLKRANQIGGVAKAIQNDGDLTGLNFDIKALRQLLRAGFRVYEAEHFDL